MDRKIFILSDTDLIMRLILSDNSKKELFNNLKNNYEVKTLKELSKRMNIPYKTIRKWNSSRTTIPDKIISPGMNLEIIDIKGDNWGRSKGGKIGGKKSIILLKKKLLNTEFRESCMESWK
ncbi:hypothetical protein COU61_03195 [Candidatus Pacearchaeota archaeon CG10_big_fil_rev_8_21_14_0_10_35_13]|nr:MAG: hypothetical protein COU61_03195 [Candidatus Pacearchaeota archaeon CG10_big_fil_rev_8_21_14_0_10_35_13]